MTTSLTGIARNVRFNTVHGRNIPIEFSLNTLGTVIEFIPGFERTITSPARVAKETNMWSFTLQFMDRQHRIINMSVEMSGPKRRGYINEGEEIRIQGALDKNNVFQARYVVSRNTNERIYCSRFAPT